MKNNLQNTKNVCHLVVNIVKHILFYQTESPIFRDDCHDIKFYSIDAH